MEAPFKAKVEDLLEAAKRAACDELTALRARVAEMEAFKLAVASAVGIVYQAEGHAEQPGPDERVLIEVQAHAHAIPHLRDTRERAFAERDAARATVERVGAVVERWTTPNPWAARAQVDAARRCARDIESALTPPGDGGSHG